MSSLILVPSRGRPDSAARLWSEFEKTARDSDQLLFAVSLDDPTFYDYPKQKIAVSPRGCMSWEVNSAWNLTHIWHRMFSHIAFMGDDHSLANAPEWSDIVEEAGYGIFYGPDGSDNLKRELPTFWFVSRSIVDALGWISPPYMQHFYLDDAWREIGKATGTLEYIPELYVEHLHFSFGKSEKDATYNHTFQFAGPDQRKYQEYIRSQQFKTDVEKVMGLI